MNDDLRAKFEAWASQEHAYVCVLADSDSGRTYAIRHVESVWQGFQAAASLYAKDAERLREALDKFNSSLSDWARAYPEDVFPEPDMTLVRTALEARGVTIDCVSASNMRHVVTTLNNEFQAVRAALDGETK